MYVGLKIYFLYLNYDVQNIFHFSLAWFIGSHRCRQIFALSISFPFFLFFFSLICRGRVSCHCTQLTQFLVVYTFSGSVVRHSHLITEGARLNTWLGPVLPVHLREALKKNTRNSLVFYQTGMGGWGLPQTKQFPVFIRDFFLL